MNKIIPMPEKMIVPSARMKGVRDRRYTIRYPFAADATLVDLESGEQADGVTSDISLGGCFVCTSKPLRLNSRARIRLERKGRKLEAIVLVRIVKPRIGMGIEFFDLESPNNEILAEWINAQRGSR